MVRPVGKATAQAWETPDLTIDLKGTKDYKNLLEQVLRPFRQQGKTAMPEDLKPMLARLIDSPFDDGDWQFEIKWDGYRALAYVGKDGVALRSRNNLSFNSKYTAVVQALREWPVNAVVDGEIVVLSEEGKVDFGAMQNWHTQGKGKLLYYVFDLLWLEGIDLTNEPLTVRRNILAKVLPDNGIIRYSDSIEACGIDFFKTAKSNGLEGIIAKQKDAPYVPGSRTESWYKIKAETRHEAVICGYTKKRDSDRIISSLVLGVPENGVWTYIGQVGTGFTQKTLQQLFKKMNPLFTATCPFEKKPRLSAPVMWVKPQLVCEVKYTERTKDGLMRHPSYQGLREDKTATEINVEGNAVSVERKPAFTKQERSGSAVMEKSQETAVVTMDGHRLTLTHLKKYYWSKEKITKGDLINYYDVIAPFILPYMQDRPQSLNRFPNGIAGKSFYQKDMKGKADPWITTFERVSERHNERKDFLVCANKASLLYMANLGCIEMNPWHSRVTSPDYPDWCVIDLDPGAVAFQKVIQTAQVVHRILQSLAIPSFPKTSGSTGLHIYIPLGARYTYEQSRQLAELIATLVHGELPTFTSLLRNPQKRKDKIYLDYLQNRPIQTICAPYSVRPRPGATVSAPLHWDEVKKGLKLSEFTMHNMPSRVKSEGDLFTGVLERGIDLKNVLQKMASLL